METTLTIAKTTLSILDWLGLLTMGAMLGAAGQVIRQIAGIKKRHEENPGKRTREILDPFRIVMTLLIGAMAGMLAAMTLNIVESKLSAEALLTLMTAGYAGTDFIESFMKGKSK